MISDDTKIRKAFDNITYVEGIAKFKEKNILEVNEQEYRSEHITINTSPTVKD